MGNGSGDGIPVVILKMKTTAKQQRAAALACAGEATDGDDLLDLLRVLGLVDGGAGFHDLA